MPLRTYNFDAVDRESRTLVEVEGGGARDAHRIEKDLIEAAIVQDIRFLVVAAQIEYFPPRFARPRNDYDAVVRLMESIYSVPEFLPLDGVLVVGY